MTDLNDNLIENRGSRLFPNGNGASRFPVLVVDDDEAIRNLLAKTLRAAGYPCSTAASAGEALGLMDSRPPALVITDIVMPGRSGLDFLESVRQGDREVAVIVMTAYRDIDLIIRALRAGAYDYLIKPFRLEEILISVEKALQKRELILQNRAHQLELEEKVREQSSRIQASFLKTIEALVRTLGARDPETREHSLRVTELSVGIARELGLPPSEIEKIRIAAALHDIGKLGVSKKVLDKKQALLPEEIEHIHRHPLIAASILGPIDELQEIIRLIRNHHEHFDGSGYPEGKAGEEIPLGSRIIAVADAFDAITSARPYQRARSKKFAAGEIRENAGKQFGPRVVEAFLRTLGFGEEKKSGRAK